MMKQEEREDTKGTNKRWLDLNHLLACMCVKPVTVPADLGLACGTIPETVNHRGGTSGTKPIVIMTEWRQVVVVV